MQQWDPMHAARIALLEGALLGLLRAAQDDHPGVDEITATLDPDGLDVSYLAAGMPVAGEGV